MRQSSRLNGDYAVRRLVELSRATLIGTAEFRGESSFQSIQRALVATREFKVRFFRFGAAVGALAGAAVLAIVLVWMRPASESPLTFQVVNGAIGSDGHVVGSPAGTRIHFSDGSSVALDRQARTRIPELTARGGRLALSGGELEVKVRHLPEAAWSVNAGPYSVQVTGTAFKVAWSEHDRVFDVTLHEGSIIVRGPLANSLKMVAGQRLQARIDEGIITLEDTTRQRAPRAAEKPPKPAQPNESLFSESAPVVAKASSEARAGTSATSTSPAGGPVSPPELDWREKLSRGDFNAVVNDAERRGIAHVHSKGSLEELAVLADAARYARRSELAQKTLLVTRQRFPNSTRAREAAFFLGRLAEDQGALPRALGWYERYLAPGGNGVYVSQALGRRMLISHRQHGLAAAQKLAADYLARFPSGAYAEAAHKLQGR